MSQFYNRYIPPSGHSTALTRPHDNTKDDRAQKKSKKRKHSANEDDNTEKTDALKASTKERIGRAVLDKYSSARFAAIQDKDASIVLKKRPQESEPNPESLPVADSTKPNAEVDDASAGQETQSSKHSNVFSRREQSRKYAQQPGVVDDVSFISADQPNARDLVPIPQPEPTRTSAVLPNFSTRPTWQSHATDVEDVSVSFQDLGLGERIVANLKAEGIETAFPIQSAIIPRLFQQHLGRDICVSAATGSGKTLAYIVPIIEHLQKSGSNGLRAVIVVPTRELVKQVKEIADICAAGSKIKIATAVGSKSLQDEQRQLVEEVEIYDPIAYQEELNRPVNWTTFNLEKRLRRAREIDIIESTNYVTEARSKVDVLITTPGRLVDHLQNTSGFHLNDVQWLVVDEADRLLGESYQEWIDTVMPALQSRESTRKQDQILAHMRMELPPRIVRKILLSATMTQDISKLNSMGLANPELVVLGASKKSAQSYEEVEAGGEKHDVYVDETGEFHLPNSLQEIAVTLKSDAEKPMVLLELLEKHIDIKNDGDEDDRTSDSSQSSELSEGFGGGDTMTRAGPRVLVFTRSTASATRLSRLLTIMSPSLESCVATLTRSTASSASSRKALSAFKSRKTTILIATDRASRGIDVPDLENVLNYDIPGSAATYIHRVGRTARAGKVGQAWTLVEHREGRWFWSEIGGKGDSNKVGRSGKIKKIEVHHEDEALKERYERALQLLATEVRQN